MKKAIIFLKTKSTGIFINFTALFFPTKATLMADRLFSFPRKGKITTDAIPTFLQGATRAIFLIDNHQFCSYTWAGNEQKILLLHGWQSNADRWQKLLPYLKSTNKTIIAIDAPGHGFSSELAFNVPRYAAYVDVIVSKWRPECLIGHSIGGTTAGFFQYQYPKHRFEKMVLLATPCEFEILIQNFVTVLGLSSKMFVLLESHFENKYGIALKAFSLQHFLKNCQTETLIAHDKMDASIGFLEGKKIKDSIENSTFLEIKNAGHSLHDAVLYEKIARFLD